MAFKPAKLVKKGNRVYLFEDVPVGCCFLLKSNRSCYIKIVKNPHGINAVKLVDSVHGVHGTQRTIADLSVVEPVTVTVEYSR